jgi:hypothetical protein
MYNGLFVKDLLTGVMPGLIKAFRVILRTVTALAYPALDSCSLIGVSISGHNRIGQQHL